jgi:hypothetical protein
MWYVALHYRFQLSLLVKYGMGMFPMGKKGCYGKNKEPVPGKAWPSFSREVAWLGWMPTHLQSQRLEV